MVQAAPMSGRATDRPVVLVLHPSDELYGADRVLLEVLDAISSVVEPVVVLPRDVAVGPLTAELGRRGIAIERRVLPVIRRRDLSPKGIFGLALRMPIGFLNVLRLARRYHARAIHTNTAVVLGGSVAARLRGVPHVWHIHEVLEGEAALGTIVAFLSRVRRSRVIAVSNAVASAIRARNGLVTAVMLNPAPDWVQQPLPEGAPVMLMSGRVNGGKGHDIFVEAASILHPTHPDVIFRLVGGSVPGREGPYLALIAQVAEADPSGSWLTFAGWSADIASEMRLSTAVVLPSTMREPLNITALEAMAVGRPVIASDIGGLPEVVTDGITGLLVRPADPVALASAMDRLLRDPGLAASLATAAHEQLAVRFSGDRYAEAWRQLYSEAMVRR
jgi:glycosyltransferase involved in cell wall biosynthesis